jgi:hypothetical protein
MTKKWKPVPVALVLAMLVVWPAWALQEGDTAASPMPQRLARLEAIAPRQGEVMNVLGRHFGNLWFALDKANWPLAEFYLEECREALGQSVAVEPARRLSSGSTMPLKGMSDALNNTQFAGLAKAIGEKDRGKAEKLYRDAMKVCTSCHMMFERPYLRLQIPTTPPSTVIAFDPPEGRGP